MPQPDVRAQLVAGPLANVSVAYRNPEYVADRVFPIIDGVSPKAKITKFAKGAWFRDEAGIRAPGTRAKRGGYGLTSVSLNTEQFAFAKEVTKEDLRNEDAPGAPTVNMKQDAIEYVADKIDLSKEIRVASTILAQTWADGNSGGEDAEGGWSASSGNTFFADMRSGIKTVQKSTGFTPNKLLMDFATYQALLDNADVLDRLKVTDNKIVTPQLFAGLFDLNEVIIGKAIKNTATEKADGSDATMAYIWEKNAGKGMAFLYYAPPRPALKTPSAGYQYRLKGESGMPRDTYEWYENAEHQWVYEVQEEVDISAVATDAGYLWVDTYAT